MKDVLSKAGLLFLLFSVLILMAAKFGGSGPHITVPLSAGWMAVSAVLLFILLTER